MPKWCDKQKIISLININGFEPGEPDVVGTGAESQHVTTDALGVRPGGTSGSPCAGRPSSEIAIDGPKQVLAS